MERISRFTPWATPCDQLERVFVARRRFLDDLLISVRTSIDTVSRRQTLVIGPRGSGKTHLLALLYCEAQKMIDDGARLQIARLPEDPWGIVSYQHLLAAISVALGDHEPGDYRDHEARLERRYNQSGVIVVLVENLDQIFDQIGTQGQRLLRHFLQTTPTLLLIATTPRVGPSIHLQTSPFMGYFSMIRLSELTMDEACQLVRNLAQLRGDQTLLDQLDQPSARRRLAAMAQLGGNQPRWWVTLGQSLTATSIQDLAEALVENADELSPLYQDRLRALSVQQRQVVVELAQAGCALHVQELARRLGMLPTSVARTLTELRDLSWVSKLVTPWDAHLDKRRSYYELAEPLSAMALQIKRVSPDTWRAVVDFLVRWYDPDDASGWRAGSPARPGDIELLGQTEDALAALARRDATQMMGLPSPVRVALQRRWDELVAAGDTRPELAIRCAIHDDAQCLVTDHQAQPEPDKWIARAESMAEHFPADPAAVTRWARWLATYDQEDAAEAVLTIIHPPTWH